MAQPSFQRAFVLCTYLHKRLVQSHRRAKNSSTPTACKTLYKWCCFSYTSIDSTHRLETISNWLEDYSTEISPDFPKGLFLKALHIVMTENVFQLDNTFWQQTFGTSMGTSCACAYATSYWGYTQQKHILPKWQQNLIFMRRFIDDKFGILLGTSDDFINFITDINSYCQLSWETTSLSKSTTFLDLTTILICPKNTIHIKTFQKPTNLHLYIPPNSAHTPGVLKGIVWGNLRRYWLQNTYITDFITVTQQFANCLSARGCNKNKIVHLFSEAAKKLEGTINVYLDPQVATL
jgi:hypothetical protein